MGVPAEEVLLRVFVGEDDRHHGRALHEAIVLKALEGKMAGATVLAGAEGFGRSRYVRSGLNVDAGSRLPMVVEIVDNSARIDRFLTEIQDMVGSGLVTLEKVRVIRYRRRRRVGSDDPAEISPVGRARDGVGGAL